MLLQLLDKLASVVMLLLQDRAALNRQVADLEKALAEEKAKPPVGQEELDKANQKAADAEARATAAEQAQAAVQAEYDKYKADDVDEDSKAANQVNGLLDAISAAVQPPTEPTPEQPPVEQQPPA